MEAGLLCTVNYCVRQSGERIQLFDSFQISPTVIDRDSMQFQVGCHFVVAGTLDLDLTRQA